MKMTSFLLSALLAAVLLPGCTGTMQRGMHGEALVSTARPALSLQAANLPLLRAGEGTARLARTSMIGGLNVRVWLAVYGREGTGDGPLAVVAHAQVPSGWHWDHPHALPGSVDNRHEIFAGTSYTACTYIVEGQKDPFARIDGSRTGQRWLVRHFAGLYNFRLNKVIMEYREPLPAAITNLETLPLGYDTLLADFAQRARTALTVGDVPASLPPLRKSYAEDVQWQYMNENFLGTASAVEILVMD